MAKLLSIDGKQFMGLARFRASVEALRHLLMSGSEIPRCTITQGLPEDAQIIDVMLSPWSNGEPRTLILLVESSKYTSGQILDQDFVVTNRGFTEAPAAPVAPAATSANANADSS